MSTKEDYKSVLFSGCAIEYKNVSLCDLRHFLPQFRGRLNGVYQVHSDNKKNLYSKLFYDINEAVDKFNKIQDSITKANNRGGDRMFQKKD